MIHIPSDRLLDLEDLRGLSGLQIAKDEAGFWLKPFSTEQVESLMIQSLPFKAIYWLDQEKLIPWGKHLPFGDVPALEWQPLDVYLSLEKIEIRANLELDLEYIQVDLVPSNQEQDAMAQLVDLSILGDYLEDVPGFRYQHLQWCLMKEKALLIGQPILPLPGATFWYSKQVFFPVGQQLRWPILLEPLRKKVNNKKSDLLIWWDAKRWSQISEYQFSTLSLAGFRESCK